MYVTRPLSHYRQFPNSLSLPPPEGPNSGYLVIQDEESEGTCCFGVCKDCVIKDLPFPQNKVLWVRLWRQYGHYEKLYFIPVLNQPLSSNQYYIIKANGKHKGEACTSSTQGDMVNCCFMNFIKDVKPRALNYQNQNQQFQVITREILCGCMNDAFLAKSIAADGFPPKFLSKGCYIYTSTPRHYQLGEAQGLDINLRSCFPHFGFPLFNKSSETVIVGKWYCPFMFVKEEGRLKDQMKRTMFYEMTLEQQWEQIYSCENNPRGNNIVVVDVYVQGKVPFLFGKETVNDNMEVMDGWMWFRSLNSGEGGYTVGLSLAIVERMKWEQERGGWVDGGERKVRIERIEEFGGKSEWRKFGCYVLVERFSLRRKDGSLFLTYEFKHTHQIQSKWE